MNNVYISTLNNPFLNIAFERQLSETFTDEVSLFLWQNEDCVVIGRNQNPLAECNLDYLKNNSIHLARRYSGGGAVFHDLGNINYTLVIKEKDYDLEKAKYFLLKVFEYLKLEVEFSGRNDMTIDGCKFSGQAYYSHKNMYVLHGTLLVDLKLSTLSKCLTPSKIKLDSKGIKSVKSRVINLKEVKPEIAINEISLFMIKAFNEVYGDSKPTIEVNESHINKELSDFIQTDDWIFSQSPKFNIELEKRFPFGIVSLQLLIKNNKIIEAKIFTDSLNTKWDDLSAKLINVSFDEEHIWSIIKDYSISM
ncbi:hypothetical protein CI105_06140 [Candidatus Izimaplasma bacterium ZiA1]|uniref:lipoate--protein ligase n=1 Tax=Candidatus Izimoplasma sp. ZiA1 TaxID=2024899 RepID=UPI000BAA87AA|nr:hypothetical protein CI105_06140 [Candidatus Izimaplasma bacterium ZiA1]